MKDYQMRLQTLTGYHIRTPQALVSYCAYIQWATLAGLDLYFDARQMDLNYCMAMSDSKQYSVSYGLPELWKLGSFEFLRELNKTAKDLLDGKSVTHKFTHYAAHAETLS
jgi:hypothetical protein